MTKETQLALFNLAPLVSCLWFYNYKVGCQQYSVCVLLSPSID